jgi:hypothetical protein
MKKHTSELNDSLHFLHVSELKEICAKLGISYAGLKKVLIDRIMEFLESGKEKNSSSYPEKSRAKKGDNAPLSPRQKILFGAYKNDLKTRVFFKKLIGNYFHFTAFGQDWIKKRWLSGDPPTYQEFAHYWKEEYQKRKEKRAQPKKEWAYITFIQKFTEKHPAASRKEITQAWKIEREKRVKRVKELLDA